MRPINSIASFWKSYMLTEKSPKLLGGETVPPASGDAPASLSADAEPGDSPMEDSD